MQAPWATRGIYPAAVVYMPGLRDDASVVAATRQQKGDLGIIQAEQFAD